LFAACRSGYANARFYRFSGFISVSAKTLLNEYSNKGFCQDELTLFPDC